MTLRVCVTGANGFVGSHIVRKCLAQGFEVLAIVRAPHVAERVGHLEHVAGAQGRLTIHDADVMNTATLTPLAEGCHGFIHAAAAATLYAKDPRRNIVDVAVEGTRSALNAAHAAGVSRFVLTSSVSAVYGFDRPADYIFTDQDWCDDATLRNNPYGIAKRDAERLMWEFSEGTSLQCVSLNPGLVVGPVLCPGHLSSSMSVIRDIVGRAHPGHPPMWQSLVDVDAVADAHVRALTVDTAIGRRFLLVGEGMWWADTARRLGETYRVARKELPLWLLRLVTATDPRVSWQVLRPLLARPFHTDGAPARKILGVAYADVNSMLLAGADSLEQGGYVPRARRV